MAKFTIARPRLKTAGPAIRPAHVDVEITTSPERRERVRLYGDPRWQELRTAHLRHEPRCAVCGRWGRIVDHLLGQDNRIAINVANHLDLRDLASADWRARFWLGPFLTLCDRHHGEKTRAEQTGHLLDWVKKMQGP